MCSNVQPKRPQALGTRLCFAFSAPPNRAATCAPCDCVTAQSVLKAANRECSSVVSLADFCRSLCIFPAAEKTRSTPPVEAGAAKYCLAICPSAGHLRALTFHQSSTGPSYVNVWHICVHEVRLELVHLGRLLSTCFSFKRSFLTLPRRAPRLTLRFFVGGSCSAGAGAGVSYLGGNCVKQFKNSEVDSDNSFKTASYLQLDQLTVNWLKYALGPSLAGSILLTVSMLRKDVFTSNRYYV